MHHELTGLSGGTGDAGTQHEVVKTDFEIGEHRVTGLAGGAGRLLVSGAKLLLGDAVLGAQTLLLAQTNRVIGFGATTGAAVLTGSVRALFEDALSLGGQCDAEGAGKAHLTARTLNVGHSCSFILSLSERNARLSPR